MRIWPEAVCCVAATTVLLTCGGAGGSGPLIGPAVQLEVRAYAGRATRAAFVSVPYLRTDTRARLVNVVADLDGNGAIAEYGSGTAQQEWVVRNVPVVLAATRYGHFFELHDASVANGRTVRVRVVLGDSALASPPLLGGAADALSVEVSVQTHVADARPLVTARTGIGTGMASGAPYDQWLCEPPGDIDVPSGHYQSGFPAAPQGPNACVPISIANSMGWLARRHHFEDCLQSMTSTGDPTGAADTAQIQNLSQLVDEVGMLGYTPENGVAPSVVEAGKNRFVAAMGLPITTTVVDNQMAGANVYSATTAAIARGCAVEIMVVGGGMQHMVNAIGFFDGMIGAPYRTLVIHDNEHTTESFSQIVEVTPSGATGAVVDGFPINGQPTRVTIARAYIQCVGQIEAVRLGYDHGPFRAGQIVHTSCFTGTHVAMPDACTCRHLHGSPATITHGAMTSGPIVDQNPMECGHGCVDMYDVSAVNVTCWRRGP